MSPGRQQAAEIAAHLLQPFLKAPLFPRNDPISPPHSVVLSGGRVLSLHCEGGQGRAGCPWLILWKENPEREAPIGLTTGGCWSPVLGSREGLRAEAATGMLHPGLLLTPCLQPGLHQLGLSQHCRQSQLISQQSPTCWGGQAGTEGGLAVATMMEQLCCALVLLDGGRNRRTFPSADVSIAAGTVFLGPAGKEGFAWSRRYFSP